jgi:hypothetical protein
MALMYIYRFVPLFFKFLLKKVVHKINIYTYIYLFIEKHTQCSDLHNSLRSLNTAIQKSKGHEKNANREHHSACYINVRVITLR